MIFMFQFNYFFFGSVFSFCSVKFLFLIQKTSVPNKNVEEIFILNKTRRAKI